MAGVSRQNTAQDAAKHVSELTDEDKDAYLDLIRDGLDPGSAAQQVGSTGHQFRKLRTPESQWYEPGFAMQVDTALNDKNRRRNQAERADQPFWAAVDRGEKWAVEKAQLIYNPDWEPLRHHNLRVTGSIEHTARLLLPHMTTDEVIQRLEQSGMSRAEIDERVETLKREKEPLALPPAT